VNDLEQPAFANLPELKLLKDRLKVEGRNKYSSVFMSGSGSTIVCWVSLPSPHRFPSDTIVARTEGYTHVACGRCGRSRAILLSPCAKP
jgi:hypothetical protein